MSTEESAVLMNALIRDQPVKIQRVTIDGLTRTNANVINNELHKVVSSKRAKELHDELTAVTKRLENFGVFASIDSNIEVTEATADRYIANVKLRIKERGIPNITTSTFLSENKGGNSIEGEMKASLRNALGYCEIVSLKAGKTTAAIKESDMELKVSIPSIGKDLFAADVAARSYTDDTSHISSFSTRVKSFSSKFTLPNSPYNIALELAFRNKIPLTHPTVRNAFDASHAVIASAAPSTKVSLSYGYSSDTRDNAQLPTRGAALNSQLELSLPPGSVRFLKLDLTAQSHTLLSPIRLDGEPGLIGSVCYQLGVIQPYGSRSVNLCDRYHLGGPLALRGFSVAGAGPRAAVSPGFSDSLGSLRRAQVLGMLSVPLPRTIQSLPPIRALLFANAGSVDDGTASLGAKTTSQWFYPFGAPRLSIGCGLTMNTGPMRLEMTYSLPLLKARDDLTRGFQLGVGLSMLG